MTTIELASIKNKPQDQQQLHVGKQFWSNRMTFANKLYFICWNGLYFGHYLVKAHNCLGPPSLLVEGLLSMGPTSFSFYLLVEMELPLHLFSGIHVVRTRPAPYKKKPL